MVPLRRTLAWDPVTALLVMWSHTSDLASSKRVLALKFTVTKGAPKPWQTEPVHNEVCILILHTPLSVMSTLQIFMICEWVHAFKLCYKWQSNTPYFSCKYVGLLSRAFKGWTRQCLGSSLGFFPGQCPFLLLLSSWEIPFRVDS